MSTHLCNDLCNQTHLCNRDLRHQYTERGRDSIIWYANKGCVVQCSQPLGQIVSEHDILQIRNTAKCASRLAVNPHPNIARYYCSNFNYNPSYKFIIRPRTPPVRSETHNPHFRYTQKTLEIDTVILIWLVDMVLQFYQYRLDQTSSVVGKERKLRGKQTRYRTDIVWLIKFQKQLVSGLSLSNPNTPEIYDPKDTYLAISVFLQKYLLAVQLPDVINNLVKGKNPFIAAGYKVKQLTQDYRTHRLNPEFQEVISYQTASIQERGLILLQDYLKTIKQAIPQEVFFSKLVDLMCGILHFHDLGFAHTDLHLKNAMIFPVGKTRERVIKIIDLSNIQLINQPPLNCGAPFLLTPALLKYWFTDTFEPEDWNGLNRQQDLFGMACIVSIAISEYLNSGPKSVSLNLLQTLWGNNPVFKDSSANLQQVSHALVTEIQNQHYLPKGLRISIKDNPGLKQVQRIARSLARCDRSRTQSTLEHAISQMVPYYAPHHGSLRVLFYGEYTCPPLKNDILFIKELLLQYDRVYIIPCALNAKQASLNQQIWTRIAHQDSHPLVYWNWKEQVTDFDLETDYVLVTTHYAQKEPIFGNLSELHYVLPYHSVDKWKANLRLKLQRECPVDMNWRVHLLQRDIRSAETHEQWSYLIEKFKSKKTGGLKTLLSHYIPETIGFDAVESILAMVFTLV